MSREVVNRLHERLAANQRGGGGDRIQRQHEQGKLTARERVEQFLDEGTFAETDALVAAAQVTGLVAGPAAAQMTWRGWRSRPVWRVLLFSAEDQPLHRAIVLVDGVTGEVLEHFVEDNPEDWSQL
mgnify:CR=1 FL=1